jgi:hypothetical protein
MAGVMTARVDVRAIFSSLRRIRVELIQWDSMLCAVLLRVSFCAFTPSDPVEMSSARSRFGARGVFKSLVFWVYRQGDVGGRPSDKWFDYPAISPCNRRHRYQWTLQRHFTWQLG